jgi:hypothetical protein
MLEEDEILDQQRSLIRLFENELTDDIAVQRVLQDYCSPPEMLSASCRFQLGSGTSDSGLDSENAMTMINGVSMNKSYDGRPQAIGRTKRCHPKSGIYYRYRPFRLYFWWNIGTQEINTRASIYRTNKNYCFGNQYEL